MSNSDLNVWLDGKIIKYDDAKVPILTHSLQYGSGIFEGIRAYDAEGAAIFRLSDHIERFMKTAKIYSMKLGYTKEELQNAVIDVVKSNGIKECYIRPFAFYNDDNIGLGVEGKKLSVFVANKPFGKYLGKEEDNGVRAKISTWDRLSSRTLPIQAKASGNYLNSIIASIEAKASGFDEAIMLSLDGSVAEGAAENIFLVSNGRIITPDMGSDILLGITRSTVMELAKDLGYSVEERRIHKEELYTADEVFFAGTAVEIAGIVNIDGITIGNGKVGSITSALKKKYMDVVHGKEEKYLKWLTKV